MLRNRAYVIKVKALQNPVDTDAVKEWEFHPTGTHIKEITDFANEVAFHCIEKAFSSPCKRAHGWKQLVAVCDTVEIKMPSLVRSFDTRGGNVVNIFIKWRMLTETEKSFNRLSKTLNFEYELKPFTHDE